MQIPYELDLRDLMDTQYGVGCWTYRTDVGVGSDAGPAVATGAATLRSTMGRGRGNIIVPPTGIFLFNTSPGDLSGINLKGPCGYQASAIVCNMAKGAFLSWSGAGGYTGGGVQGLTILLESGLGLSNTYAIMLKGDAQYQPDATEFAHLNVSSIGGSKWWDCVHMDASARSGSGAPINGVVPPQGCRVTDWYNIELFEAHNIAAYFNNPVELSLNEFGCYVGSGPTGTSVIVTGNAADVSGTLVNATVSVQGATTNVMINGTKYS